MINFSVYYMSLFPYKIIILRAELLTSECHSSFPTQTTSSPISRFSGIGSDQDHPCSQNYCTYTSRLASPLRSVNKLCSLLFTFITALIIQQIRLLADRFRLKHPQFPICLSYLKDEKQNTLPLNTQPNKHFTLNFPLL